jgi:hypothetical protein
MYYPDVDLPVELFRDQIAMETRNAGVLQKFDPTLGDLMDTLYFESGSNQTGALAFPMGETGCDLST